LETDWAQIVRDHGPLVWRTALRLLFNEADTADCFQETFVSAMEYSKSKPLRNVPGLLRRIAIARALDQLRKRRRDRLRQSMELTEAMASRDADPLREAQAKELSDRLRLALVELPENQSHAFCLRYLNGLEYDEIAAEMEITVDAAGALLHRARTRLGELLLGAATVDLKRR